MTMKHTPGPWIASRGQHSPKSKDRRSFWVVNQADDGREDLMPRICDAIAPEGFDGFQQGEANARLIAAAPDLLAALTRLLAVFKAARQMAIREQMMSSPLVTELQTAGGAEYAAEESIAKATEGTP